jgi:hypothetical protein
LDIEATLTNGHRHIIAFEKSKEDFFDIIKFNRDSFLQDKNGVYFIVSSIMSFAIEGEKNGSET